MSSDADLLSVDRFEVFATGLDHPECLAFDRDGYLWAGGEAGQVYRIDGTGRVETITTLSSFNGGIAFDPSDAGLIVCNPVQGLVRLDRKTGETRVFATHAGSHKMLTPNFPVYDRAGNLYVTDSGQWKKQNGALLRFTADGRGEVIAGPFGYANGLALSADERTLYMVESNTDRVLCFDVNRDGCVDNPQVYAEQVGRLPDGLALDAAGDLYAACYASDEILRIDRTTRAVTRVAWDHFAILLGRPTNIAFGGDAFDEIYVANLGRYTITRAKLGVRGQPLANLATTSPSERRD
jgi:gluconolactonase